MKEVILNERVPAYFQDAEENTCGPEVLRMVADYFSGVRGGRLQKAGQRKILEITMKGNRLGWTSKKDLKRALKWLGLRHRELRGGDDAKVLTIQAALRVGNPVIVSCRIPYKGDHVTHYSVVVGVGPDGFCFRDPFPYGGKKSRSYRPVPYAVFMKKRSEGKQTVWGRSRWGIVVSCGKSKHVEIRDHA
jgi:hypothetical protein